MKLLPKQDVADNNASSRKKAVKSRTVANTAQKKQVAAKKVTTIRNSNKSLPVYKKVPDKAGRKDLNSKSGIYDFDEMSSCSSHDEDNNYSFWKGKNVQFVRKRNKNRKNVKAGGKTVKKKKKQAEVAKKPVLNERMVLRKRGAIQMSDDKCKMPVVLIKRCAELEQKLLAANMQRAQEQKMRENTAKRTNIDSLSDVGNDNDCCYEAESLLEPCAETPQEIAARDLSECFGFDDVGVQVQAQRNNSKSWRPDLPLHRNPYFLWYKSSNCLPIQNQEPIIDHSLSERIASNTPFHLRISDENNEQPAPKTPKLKQTCLGSFMSNVGHQEPLLEASSLFEETNFSPLKESTPLCLLAKSRRRIFAPVLTEHQEINISSPGDYSESRRFNFDEDLRKTYVQPAEDTFLCSNEDKENAPSSVGAAKPFRFDVSAKTIAVARTRMPEDARIDDENVVDETSSFRDEEPREENEESAPNLERLKFFEDLSESVLEVK